MTISVILPNYNHKHFLSEALDAILSQSYLPTEILVIDDASTDGSVELVQEYQKKHPFIHLYQNERNLGPPKTINMGIQKSKGTYLTFGSANDYLFPSFLQEAVIWMEKHPSMGICSGDVYFFKNKKPYFFKKCALNSSLKPSFFSPDEMEKVIKKTSFFIHTSACLYRKEAVLQYQGYTENLKHLADWYLNYLIALDHGVGYLPQPFAAFRFMKASYSYSLQSKRKIRNALYEKLIENIESLDTKKKDLFLKTGLLGQIGVHMIEYLLMRPSKWRYFSMAFYKKCHYFLKK